MYEIRWGHHSVKLIEKFLEAVDLHHIPKTFTIPRLVAKILEHMPTNHQVYRTLLLLLKRNSYYKCESYEKREDRVHAHLTSRKHIQGSIHQTPDRLISNHGRWKSARARNGYIKDNLPNRLSITHNLGFKYSDPPFFSELDKSQTKTCFHLSSFGHYAPVKLF